jgi:hypothetical protein
MRLLIKRTPAVVLSKLKILKCRPLCLA